MLQKGFGEETGKTNSLISPQPHFRDHALFWGKPAPMNPGVDEGPHSHAFRVSSIFETSQSGNFHGNQQLKGKSDDPCLWKAPKWCAGRFPAARRGGTLFPSVDLVRDDSFTLHTIYWRNNIVVSLDVFPQRA